MYSCHLLISSASVRSIPFLSFIVPIFEWNVPLVSLIFLKPSLIFPILLFYFVFALITEEAFPISTCYSLELSIQMGISFLFSFAFSFSFFSQLFIRPPQTTILQSFCLFAFLFLGDDLDNCLLYNVTNLLPYFFSHSIRYNPLNPFLTSTV